MAPKVLHIHVDKEFSWCQQIVVLWNQINIQKIILGTPHQDLNATDLSTNFARVAFLICSDFFDGSLENEELSFSRACCNGHCVTSSVFHQDILANFDRMSVDLVQ